MDNGYDENVSGNDGFEEDDLFLKHVIRDDHDLHRIDALLRNAFAIEDLD